MSRLSSYLPLLWAVVVLFTDFFSKRIVLAHAESLQQKVEVIGDLLRFAYVRNAGAAMGLFPVGRTALIVISLVATGFLVALFLRTSTSNVLRRSAIAAILGGALGNLVDRIFYDGLVVDFIDIGIGTHRFYTFNVADMGVTLGGLVLFISLLKETQQQDGVVTTVSSATESSHEETVNIRTNENESAESGADP